MTAPADRRWPRGATPSPRARAAGRTAPACRRPRARTNTAPSAKRGASSCIVRRASRVLPTPPGPIRQQQAAFVARQQVGDALQLDRAADEAVVGRAGRGRADAGRRRPRAGRTRRAGRAAPRRAPGRGRVDSRSTNCAVGRARRAGLPVARQRAHVLRAAPLRRAGRPRAAGPTARPPRRLDRRVGQRGPAPRRATPCAGGRARSSTQRVQASLCAVVEAGQQLAAVGGQRVAGALLAQRRLEVGDVGRDLEAQRRALQLDRRRPTAAPAGGTGSCAGWRRRAGLPARARASPRSRPAAPTGAAGRAARRAGCGARGEAPSGHRRTRPSASRTGAGGPPARAWGGKYRRALPRNARGTQARAQCADLVIATPRGTFACHVTTTSCRPSATPRWCASTGSRRRASSVYVKLESFNPLGSVKDRMARAVIEDAERTRPAHARARR